MGRRRATSPDNDLRNAVQQPCPDPDITRSLIQHEDELISQRLTWFITLQGLLFAALGFAWDKVDARGLIAVFCVLGILSSISTAFALWGGAAAIERLADANKASPDPIIGRQAHWWEKFAYPWFAFPVLFVLTWASVFWLNWRR